MALETKALYEFAEFRLDPGQHLLLRQGKPVALTPKAFELLVVLIQSGGRLLTKDDLMKKVWPDSFVEEANLTVNISSLRKTLGDSLEGQAIIETVPKLGYRFVTPVKEVIETQTGSATPTRAEPAPVAVSLVPVTPVPVTAADDPVSRTATREYLRIAAVAALIVGVAIAAAVFLRSGNRPASVPPQKVVSHRLAILPFQNLRKDPDTDFLGYSLADAVITKLGYFKSLQVRPSYAVAKYRDQVIDVSKVSADLDVDTVLTGNFIRDGQDLRITCQLVDIASQSILWRGEIDLKYERLLTVHDNVAAEIVKGLELNLTPSEAERLKPDKPVNPLAYEYYLRAVDLYSRSDFPTAAKMFEKSAELDPNYALTWAYLGRSYNASASFQFGGRDDYHKAQAAFDKALSLQPEQIEARIYIGNFLTDTGRVEQAVPLLRDGLKANPDHAELHWELGYAYRFAGMLPESVAECELARRLDPLVKINSSALNTYLYLGEYDKFVASLPKGDDTAFLVFYRGFAEYHTGQRDEAARDFDRAYELNRTLLQAQVGKALSYAVAKKPAAGLSVLRAAERKISERGVGDSEAIYKVAQAYAVLGDHAAALRVLRVSIENGFFAYAYFERDPLLEGLRRDAEFERLMKTAQERHDKFQKTFF